MSVPLSRNRDYCLLWTSQVASEVGFNASTIAFPLLVLALTGSPAASGLVLGADAAAQLVVGVPAGALADRWNRKTIMLVAEAVQAVALASLVLALWWQVATVPHMVAVAVVMGVCRALFEPAEEASLPRVVPEHQLATAVAMNAARGFLGQLSGTALGGVLFAVRRWLPFAVDAVAHAASFVALVFLRLPPREREHAPIGQLHREVWEGLRWVGRQPVVRTVALCAVGLNLFFYAFYLVVIVLAEQRGLPSAEIGVMASMLGVGGMLGAFAAPRLHRMVSPYLSIIGVFWALTLLTPVTIVLRNGYLIGGLFALMAFLAPVANTTINTYQLLLTPDELRGRLTGVMSVVLGAAAAAGPALGGGLMQVVPGDPAVLVCTAGIAVMTLLATVNPTLRRFPRRHPEPDTAAESAEPDGTRTAEHRAPETTKPTEEETVR
jgi:MFS family permease